VVDRGLALGPDAGLLDLRGDALAGQGRSEDALATWSRAYELHAENLSPRYSRACSLDRLGRHEEAIAESRAAGDGRTGRRKLPEPPRAAGETTRARSPTGSPPCARACSEGRSPR
jgi:tetratricopeptide (TPR) repeat protein